MVANVAYIAVAAPSDIVYVAGSINSNPTTFQSRDGKWYGYAPAAEDNTYHLWVEMVDAPGTVVSMKLPLYMTCRGL